MTEPATSPQVATDDHRMAQDPRLALIYGEALRALQVQLAHWEGLRARGGKLVFVGSFAGSLLGGQALSDGLGAWDWLALALLAGIGLLVVVILWPSYDVHFRFDVEELLRKYIDGAEASSLAKMQRDLTLQLKHYMDMNGRLIRRTRVALQSAFILLVLEVIAWLLSIASR